MSPTLLKIGKTRTSREDWDDIVVWMVQVDRNDLMGYLTLWMRKLCAELMKPRNPVSNYVDDVLNGKNSICKRESPLSE